MLNNTPRLVQKNPLGLDNASGVQVDELDGAGSFYVKLGDLIGELEDDLNSGSPVFDTGCVGSAVVVINPEEEISVSIQDALGRTVASGVIAQDGTPITWSTVKHDAVVEVSGYGDCVETARIDALNHQTKSRADAVGRVMQSIDALSEVTSMQYDANGNLLRVRDPNSVGWDAGTSIGTFNGYDYQNRLVAKTDTEGGTVEYDFDKAGNQTSLTDPEENETVWTFDARGRVSTETNELSAVRSFRYDENGNLRFRVARDSRVRAFVYNTANLTTDELWYNSVSDAQSDNNRQNTISYTYDSVHRMTGAADSSSNFDYDYTLDMANRTTSAELDVLMMTPNVTINQTFDDANRRSQVGVVIATTADLVNDYTYDDAGRMTRVAQQGNGGNTVSEKRVDFSYDDANRFDDITRYNNVAGTQTVAVSAYTFNNANRMTALSHDKGANNLADYDWGYDDGGRITAQDFTSSSGTYGDADYTYDDTNQLTASDYDADWQTDEAFTYDDNGNRTNGSYTTGTNNLLTSDGTYYYTYDAEGNRTARFVDNDSSGTLNSGDTDITEYVWDHRNRLTMVTAYSTYGGDSTKSTALVYDHQNRWIVRGVDPDGSSGAADVQVTAFVYDGNQILLQFEKAGGAIAATDLTHRYLWGPQVDQILADEYLASGIGGGGGTSTSTPGITRRSAGPRRPIVSRTTSTNPVVSWPLCDHLQSVRDIAVYNSGTDTTTVVNHRIYDAFGRLTAETGATVPLPFYYTARPLDSSTSLQNNLNRWYDSAVGRWLSEDPIGYLAGDANLYRYVFNIPTEYIDPIGFATDYNISAPPGWHNEGGIHGRLVPDKKKPERNPFHYDGSKIRIEDGQVQVLTSGNMLDFSKMFSFQSDIETFLDGTCNCTKIGTIQIDKSRLDFDRSGWHYFGMVWAWWDLKMDAAGNIDWGIDYGIPYPYPSHANTIDPRVPMTPGVGVSAWGSFMDEPGGIPGHRWYRGQTVKYYTMDFEVHVVCLEGKDRGNTYGGFRWGFSCVLKPNASGDKTTDYYIRPYSYPVKEPSKNFVDTVGPSWE